MVETGAKTVFLEHLEWLGVICPIAYCFRNTPDGYKLFQDGIFASLRS
jgi:hypothetical protein